MKAFSKKLLAVAAGLALTSVSALASHVPALSFGPEKFIVNPLALNTVPGATAPETNPAFVAGSISFDYRALVTQDGTVSPATFAENGSVFFNPFRVSVGGQAINVATSGLGLNYELYALFTALGTSTTNGAGGRDGLFNDFGIQFFVDRDSNTTFNASGTQTSTAPTGGIADDVLVLTGNLQVGGFHVFPNLAAGDFDVIFNVTGFGATSFFSTTTDGQRLSQGDLNGVNSTIIGLGSGTGSFVNAEIDGSGNNTYQSIPEPTSLALVGIALVGGALARRKAQA